MSELEFEYEYSPEREFEKLRQPLATQIGASVTAALNDQLNEQLADGVEPETNGITTAMIRTAAKSAIAGIPRGVHPLHLKVSVALLRPKSQERPTGSDIAIFFEVLPGLGSPQPMLSKTLLVQAKVGKLNSKGELSASDKHLPSQIRQIAKVSPNDGFLLIYTKKGAYCVGITEAIKSLKGNTVRTKVFKPAGDMLARLVLCTSGNVQAISPVTLKPGRDATGHIHAADAADALAALGKRFLADEAVSLTVIMDDKP
jgi:hypothetical protein